MKVDHYVSTRGGGGRVSASMAIARGIAPDKGLYVPNLVPSAPKPEELPRLSYKELALAILRGYLSDFSDGELKLCVDEAYDSKFDVPEIAPVKSIVGYHFLELFHGKTLAFKDMALSILPSLMRFSAEKQGIGKKILILTATSGDTGKAALEGFAGAKGVDVAVFYPSDGVSDAQKLQMTTQEGDNVFVAGINGNFDDAQTGVKKLFADPDFIREASEAGYALSSANSINIGRLAPQIVYYFHAYAQLCRNGYAASGDGVDITVPTGNFGNILAAYYAALSGLPAKRLICASNANKALYDYFATGVYDANRPFVTTSSPSMDILISSNFERFLWLLNNSGRGGAGVSTVMESLAKTGKFTYPYEGGALAGEYADENETFAAIKRAFRFGYLIDPHTAVAFAAYEKDRAKNPSGRPNIIVSTASPYKFASSVISAITGEPPKSRDFAGQIEELETLSGFPAPASLKELDQKPILHKTLCGADEMRGLLRGFMTR